MPIRATLSAIDGLVTAKQRIGTTTIHEIHIPAISALRAVVFDNLICYLHYLFKHISAVRLTLIQIYAS